MGKGKKVKIGKRGNRIEENGGKWEYGKRGTKEKGKN